MMLRSNYKYLAFDDRLLMLFGIPFLAVIIPIVFFGQPWAEYMAFGWKTFPVKILYPAAYWLFNRRLMIEMRKRFGDFTQTQKRLMIQLAIIAVSAPVVGLMVDGVLGIWNICVDYSLKDEMMREVSPEPTLLTSLPGTYILIVMMTFIYETIFLFHKYREAIEEKNKIQLAHVQGQLDNLRNQINPHFLFNSLNTLMSLIPQNTDRAMSFLSRLSRFYRYTVSSQSESLIDVDTELENAEIYAELLGERFYKALNIEIDPPSGKGWQILPLSIQLLIENAVKHNIVSQSKPLSVRVYVDAKEQYCWVENNIQLKIEEVSSTGVGLKNIRERIAYFTDRPVHVHNQDGFFRVAIPLLVKSTANYEMSHH